MKTIQTRSTVLQSWLLGMTGCLFATLPLHSSVPIVNPGFEQPSLPVETSNSFDGTIGPGGPVPGWYSNEPGNGGVHHIPQWHSGQSGNNVMYLHGSGSQNFYTAGFDLGVHLQSHTEYTLTFDVLRWFGWDSVTSITQDNYVIFRAGLYTGADYDNRTALTEHAGNFYLLDELDNPLNVRTVTLSFTTESVAPDTTFWIGGDAFGNALDAHRTHFDNFQLVATSIPEPSSALLMLGGLITGSLVQRRR